MIFTAVRRWALLLVASALAVGPVVVAPASAAAPPVFGCASGQACVHITFPDSSRAPVDVPAATLVQDQSTDNPGHDLDDVAYPVRYPSGDTRTDDVYGMSLAFLLGRVIPDPVSPDSVVSTVAINPNNDDESPLHAGDLATPSPFLNQLEPAFGVLSSGGTSQIEYIRPQRTPADANEVDTFVAGTGNPVIDLQVRTSGAVVHPAITVGTGPFTTGRAVPFTVSYPAGDPPHAGASYEWTFAAGDPPVPGPSATSHRYAIDSTYAVSVTVSGTDPGIGQFYGQSKTVSVQVGDTHTKPVAKPPGGQGKGHKHAPAQGPTTAPGHHEGSAPKGGQQLIPTGVPTDGAAPGGAPGAGSSSLSSAAPSRHATAATKHAPGVFVRGVLVEGRSAPAIPAKPQQATRAAESARRPARLGSTVDARWLWVLAPVLLLAAGALGERRRTPGRHG